MLFRSIVVGDDAQHLNAISGATGTPLPGFPIVLGAEQKGSPAVCDCDGDGKTEIIAESGDGNLYVWDYDFPFSPTLSPPWPQFHHDAERTGLMTHPLFVDTPERGPVPSAIELAPIVPNPARAAARFAYAVPSARSGSSVELAVYDLSGRQVVVLERGVARAGRHSVQWNLRDRSGARVRAGLYFLRLVLGEERQTQKFAVLR